MIINASCRLKADCGTVHAQVIARNSLLLSIIDRDDSRHYYLPVTSAVGKLAGNSSCNGWHLVRQAGCLLTSHDLC